MILRSAIVNEARTWLGTPFVHQGRLKGIGVDCLGVIAMVGRAVGSVDYDCSDYGRLPNPRRMSDELRKHLIPIAIGDMQEADVLHMAWGESPMHLGIVTPIGLLHAYSLIPAVVEHGLDATWRGRLRFAYRYPGVV